jgi:DNA-binding SARP family transcriptional activator
VVVSGDGEGVQRKMPVVQPRERAVIQSKLAVPALPDHFVERPRLNVQLAALIEGRGVVVVSATAGAGKTTALASAIALVERPAVWLTVDRTDAAPGRLLTYLEAALARRLPALSGAATGALEAGIPHAEAAGLLAEAIGEEPLVLVLDELERLGEEREAWAVVEALLRYAPAPVCIVLVSRREIPPALCALPSGAAVAVLGESELAFTPAEAADALARVGKEEIDATAAVEATGGWVTGVMFEAWRSAEHGVGGGGEADPLYGYLSSHILGQLDPLDREFLVSTSLLDEVTARRAETLGMRRAGERLVALRATHLPVSWSAEGHVMRCHSRFREYLLERLERRGEDEVRALRLAYAGQLAAEGHDEEATEEFLRADAPQEALATAERAIMSVIERVDIAIAQRWLDALADVAPTGASPFSTAELMLAASREDFRHVLRVADQLAALGERDRLAASSETAAWLMVWGYISVVRPDDVEAVLAAAQPGPVVDAARYATQVMIDSPGEGPLPRPELTGGPIDAFVYVADYALGHLGELTEESGSRWVEAVKRQWRIAALRAVGHTQRALELYEATDATATLSLQTWIGPELLIDAGRGEDARRVVAEGRRIARASGQVASEGMNALAEARLLLRADRDPAAARAVLDRPEYESVMTGFRYISEVADAWYGLALLLESDDAAALVRLRRAVEGMVAGDRLLELPTAAVYLAEAEWRAGDEEAADRAADLALQAARRQGSNHVLLQALADFPAVVTRLIDAQPSADSPWHELGRALIAQGVTLARTVQASVELREFGARAIIVNGQEERPRIAKTYELLAYLATRRPAQAKRDELLDALFAGRSDESSRAYLRQAVHWLRHALPAAAVIVEGGRVRLSDEVAISSESTRFESQLAEAARLQGEERLAATLDALAIYTQGEYLPGGHSTWADERQQQLADLATDAAYEAAEIAFAAGRYDQARTLAGQVLSADPFREAAFRLMMRISDTLGDEKGVIRAYHDCERALAELDTTPSPSTRQLLERLRR